MVFYYVIICCSWLVHEALTALGYHHLGVNEEIMLHCNYAAELEAVGLWTWAVFVLLHIKDAQR